MTGSNATLRIQIAIQALRDCLPHLQDGSDIPGDLRTDLLAVCGQVGTLAVVGATELTKPAEAVSAPENGALPTVRHEGQEVVVAYVDGACSGNPGPGGWAVAIEKSDGSYLEMTGGSSVTTNNQMELAAAIAFLQRLPAGVAAVVYADSQYVINGVTDWLHGWKRNGWRTSSKKPVSNEGLWRQIDELLVGKNITWKWVRGHSGHPGNERADRLAVSAIPR